MDEESLLPDNAEVELKRAYNSCIETGVTYAWRQNPLPDVPSDEVFRLYRHAMELFEQGSPPARLTAERWARVVKHLALACWHEAKIDYLSHHGDELSCLPHARTEFHLHAETRETARSLLDSAAQRLRKTGAPPAGIDTAPTLLERGRAHLKHLEGAAGENELLHAEHIKAAHEYGRVLEYYLLARESESQLESPAA